MSISKRSGPRQKLQSSQGQTTPEWLMIAGVFGDELEAAARHCVAGSVEAGRRADVTALMVRCNGSPHVGRRSQPAPPPGDSLAMRCGQLRLRLASSRGQTTTEWLMTAGALAAMAAFIGRVVPTALRAFVGGLTWGIRTIAP